MPIDPFDRSGASAVAAESGYSAPYLYLLEDDRQSEARLRPNAYTRRKVDSVCRAIRAGYGQGRGDTYNPWIRIRRNFSSPVSHQIFDSIGLHARNHHFLSTLEFHTALVCSYIGAVELRECLPIWPHPHPHPATDVEQSQHSDMVPGLLEIAAQAGIEHGCFVGTTVPYVASIDLMFNIPDGASTRLLGISCKPRAIFEQSHRARERIELDRIYCTRIDAHHIHEDGASFDPVLLMQLQWLRPLVSEIRQYRGSSLLIDFARWFDRYASVRCVLDATLAAGCRVRAKPDFAFMLFRLCVWLHLIDIDLTQRVLMKQPVKRGGSVVLDQLRKRYWGTPHV
jgi:hypothetical protein